MNAFYKKVEEICRKDQRYKPEAYEFLMRALSYTQRRLRRIRHVTGGELSYGVKDLALEEYGPLAINVLEHWGIKATEDLGNIVYNLIDAGLMSKTKEDKLEDFKDVFDFKEAFSKGLKIELEG